MELNYIHQQVNKDFFYFAEPHIPLPISNSYPGSKQEKEIIYEMINEWNSRICISDLSKKWKKERPPQN